MAKTKAPYARGDVLSLPTPPVLRQAPASCPIWCDVPDHANLDGGQGVHQTYDTYDLHRHPAAAPYEDHHETVIVGLETAAGEDEPYISIVPRCEEARCETQLTLDEAERVAGHLGVLIRKGRAAVDHDQSVRLLIRALANQRPASES
jgi:hypothetical protein